MTLLFHTWVWNNILYPSAPTIAPPSEAPAGFSRVRCERARSWNCWALDSSISPIFHQQAVSSARAATLRHQMNLAKGTMWTFLLFDAKTCLSGATAVHINTRCFTRHWHFLSRQLALNVGKSPISFMTV